MLSVMCLEYPAHRGCYSSGITFPPIKKSFKLLDLQSMIALAEIIQVRFNSL